MLTTGKKWHTWPLTRWKTYKRKIKYWISLNITSLSLMTFNGTSTNDMPKYFSPPRNSLQIRPQIKFFRSSISSRTLLHSKEACWTLACNAAVILNLKSYKWNQVKYDNQEMLLMVWMRKWYSTINKEMKPNDKSEKRSRDKIQETYTLD